MISLQFGARGCMLDIDIDVRNLSKRLTIGDRHDISRIVLRHKNIGTFDVSGTWYVYKIKSITDTLFTYTFIRNSSDLCKLGDGTSMLANEVEKIFSMPGFKTDNDFYFTFEPSIAKYKTIVRIAHKLKYKSMPLFLPDGSFILVNLSNRPIIDMMTYNIVVGQSSSISFTHEAEGLEEYVNRSFIMNYYKAYNVFYPPGTLIKTSQDDNMAIYISDLYMTCDSEGIASQTMVYAYLIVDKQS